MPFEEIASPVQVTYYPIEHVRRSFERACREYGTPTEVIDALGMSLDIYYKVRARRMPIPIVALHRLALRKVCEGLKCTGYICHGEIQWQNLWERGN